MTRKRKAREWEVVVMDGTIRYVRESPLIWLAVQTIQRNKWKGYWRGRVREVLPRKKKVKVSERQIKGYIRAKAIDAMEEP